MITKELSLPKMRSITLGLFSLIILLTACRNDKLIRNNDPIDVAYDKSYALFENGKYGDAAYGFDLITRRGRGTNFAENSQFYLGESYFLNKRYLLAASEYERFISFYPQSDRREEVEYRLALSYYEQSPRYRLDQSTTYRALELLQLFNTKYPNSEYVVGAADKIDELRNKLARKNFEAAEFYLRTDQFKSATIYFDQTIDLFPESKWAEEALVKQVQTYIIYADKSIDEKQAERYGMAITNYEKFIQLFPQSKKREEVEGLYNEAASKLAKVGGSASGDNIGSN